MNICGFVLVRKPMENYYSAGQGIWPKRPPRIADIFYGGVWRMPWCDIAFEHYASKLPADINDLYLANVTDLQGSGFELCRALDIADRLLEFSNSDRQKCELIALYSPRLAVMKGTMDVDNVPLAHQGWEPFQIGGGSLLLDGIFAVPDQFPTWKERLNTNGLLTSSAECERYVSEYQRLAGTGLLEETFPVELCPIEPVEIFSVPPSL
jgi:hypothetical protein